MQWRPADQVRRPLRGSLIHHSDCGVSYACADSAIEKVTEATLIFVALDRDGRPRPVDPSGDTA